MSQAKFHLPRRTTQLGTLLILTLIPLIGLFRIDLATASFHILGQQIWWSNFAFTIGLVVVLITGAVLSYMTISTVWCGWACPQNLLVEWANRLTHKYLGKRADVKVDGKGLVIARDKNKLVNWLTLGLLFAAASLALALIPLLYFLPPGEVLEFITFRANNQVTSFFTFPYFFIAFLIFIDIGFVRYFFCDYACMYRWGQIIFKTKNALHIGYDASRSADCARCNFCSTACVTEIEPTEIKSGDRCIGCGECVDACDQLHAKTETIGLLRFQIGNQGASDTWKKKLKGFSTLLNWILTAFALLGATMMAWGMITQVPPPQPIPPEVLAKQHRIERICDAQCRPYITACKDKDLKGCYQASACKCECNAQQDPDIDPNVTQQCVKRYSALAEALEKNNKP